MKLADLAFGKRDQRNPRELATPKPKAPPQALEAAKEYFEENVASAAEFLEGYKFYMGRRSRRLRSCCTNPQRRFIRGYCSP